MDIENSIRLLSISSNANMEVDEENEEIDRVRRMSIVIEGSAPSRRDANDVDEEEQRRTAKRPRLIETTSSNRAIASAQLSLQHAERELKQQRVKIDHTNLRNMAHEKIETLIRADERFPFYSELAASSGRGGVLDVWAVFNTRSIEQHLKHMDGFIRQRELLELTEDPKSQYSQLVGVVKNTPTSSSRPDSGSSSRSEPSEITRLSARASQLTEQLSSFELDPRGEDARIVEWWARVNVETFKEDAMIDQFPKVNTLMVDQISGIKTDLKNTPFESVANRNEIIEILWNTLKQFFVNPAYAVEYRPITIPLTLNLNTFAATFPQKVSSSAIATGKFSVQMIRDIIKKSPLFQETIGMKNDDVFDSLFETFTPAPQTQPQPPPKRDEKALPSVNGDFSTVESFSGGRLNKVLGLKDPDGSSNNANTKGYQTNLLQKYGAKLPWLKSLINVEYNLSDVDMDAILIEHFMADALLNIKTYSELLDVIGKKASDVKTFGERLEALWKTMDSNDVAEAIEESLRFQAWFDVVHIRGTKDSNLAKLITLDADDIASASVQVIHPLVANHINLFFKTFNSQIKLDDIDQYDWPELDEDERPLKLANALSFDEDSSLASSMSQLKKALEQKRSELNADLKDIKTSVDDIRKQLREDDDRQSRAIEDAKRTAEAQQRDLYRLEFDYNHLAQTKGDLLRDLNKHIEEEYTQAEKLAKTLQPRDDYHYAVLSAFSAIEQSGPRGQSFCANYQNNPDLLVVNANDEIRISFATLCRYVLTRQEQVVGSRGIYQQSIYHLYNELGFVQLITKILDLHDRQPQLGATNRLNYNTPIRFNITPQSRRF